MSDTKEFILKKTLALLLVKGYDGVSISDIQKATGMSRGLLYHYFGNKESLFVEATKGYFLSSFKLDLDRVREYDMNQMIEYILEKYSAIYSVLERNDTDEQIGITNYDFLFYRVMQESPEFAEQYQQIRDIEIECWEVVLSNSLIRGDIRDGVDTGKIAELFVCLLDGVWINTVSNNKSENFIVELERVLREFYKLLIK